MWSRLLALHLVDFDLGNIAVVEEWQSVRRCSQCCVAVCAALIQLDVASSE